MARKRILTVHMPEEYVRALDELVRAGKYRSRSDAIRSAVRRLIAGLEDRHRPMIA